MIAHETLLVETRAGAAIITLNRPETRNAMSFQMVEELIAALREAEATNARAVVLTGAGGHFCSGGDVGDMAAAQAAPGGETDPLAEANARFGRLCLAYGETGLPVIAALEGAVLGGGFGLACVADVALARETTVFRLPETGLGLTPAQIAPFLVERLGYSEAKRLAVTGAKVDARTAFEIGLVHGVYEGAAAMDAAIAALLAQIRKGAPAAIAETKRLLRRARFAPAESLIEEGAAAFARTARSEEAREGLAAFLEKRPAAWAESEPG